MVDEALGRSARMQRLLKSIQDKASRRRSAEPPADDAPGDDIDDEGHIHKASPGAHIGEVIRLRLIPQHIRRWGMELPIDQIERASRRLVRRGCLHHPATHGTFQPERRHQACHAVAPDLEALAVELQPDLLGTIDTEVLLVDPDNLLRQPFVLLLSRRAKGWISLAASVFVPRGGGDPQNPAHRLDPVALHMGLHEGRHFRSGRSSSTWAK